MAKLREVNDELKVRAHTGILNPDSVTQYKQGPVDGCPVLSVDAQFRDALPPTSDDATKDLQRSLVESNGPVDSIKVWEDPNAPGHLWIVDGHRRYDICRRVGLPYEVEVIPFESRDAVLMWIDEVQVSRRNVAPMEMVRLRMRMLQRRLRLGRTLGQSLADVSKAANITASKLKSDRRTMRRYRALHPDVARAVAEMALPVADYELMGAMDHQTQLKLVDDFGSNPREMSRRLRMMASREIEWAKRKAQAEMDARLSQPDAKLAIGPDDLKRMNKALTALNRYINQVGMIKAMSTFERQKLLDAANKLENESNEWLNCAYRRAERESEALVAPTERGGFGEGEGLGGAKPDPLRSNGEREDGDVESAD